MPAKARDRDVRIAIRDALAATNAFSEVSLSDLPENYGGAASDIAVAFVMPDVMVYRDLWDGAETTGGVVRSNCIITVAQRDQDPQLCDEKVELLIDVVANAIDGKNLVPGLTVPDYSVIVNAKFQPRKSIERRVAINFAYAYIFDGWNNFNTSD